MCLVKRCLHGFINIPVTTFTTEQQLNFTMFKQNRSILPGQQSQLFDHLMIGSCVILHIGTSKTLG